jgi:membrane protease YdiL (CAAX protease family)
VTAPDRASGWRIADAAWAVLAGLAGAIVGTLLVGVDASVAALFGIVVPFQALAMIGTVLLRARSSERRTRELGLAAVPSDGWGLAIGVGLQIAAALVMYPIVIRFFEDEVPVQDIVESAEQALTSTDRLVVALAAGLLVPLAEELVFRGVLLRALRDRFSDRAAILLSALVFSAFHLLDPGAYLALPALFVLGLVMAAQVVRTGRIARAVFTHIGFNMISVIALFVLTIE